MLKEWPRWQVYVARVNLATGRVSKDLSWFETREDALLTVRIVVVVGSSARK